jgi:hypothetical protein
MPPVLRGPTWVKQRYSYLNDLKGCFDLTLNAGGKHARLAKRDQRCLISGRPPLLPFSDERVASYDPLRASLHHGGVL